MKSGFLVRENNRELKYKIFDDVSGKAKGVIIFIHDMKEHSGRYTRLAENMNRLGYICFLSDLRGHGENAGCEVLGYESGNIFEDIVDDYIEFARFLKLEYPKLPLYVLGHAFGGYIAQRLIVKLDVIVDKFIISGAGYAGCKFGAGLRIAKFMARHKSDKASAKLLENYIQNKRNKKFEDGNWLTRDEKAWAEYKTDVLCGSEFPIRFYLSFYKAIFLPYQSLSLVDESTPILLLSGEEDIETNFAKDTRKLYNLYLKHWFNVSMKTYEGAKHDLFNELNTEKVCEDIDNFLMADNKGAVNRPEGR